MLGQTTRGQLVGTGIANTNPRQAATHTYVQQLCWLAGLRLFGCDASSMISYFTIRKCGCLSQSLSACGVEQ
jgi:hypothetical protein